MSKILILCLILPIAICNFPKDFIFGVSTSALQTEGAWLQDDKAPSVWDNLAHLPGYTADGSSPEIASNSYNDYMKDIELLKNAGIKNYRLSISWPRIVPRGRRNSKINEKAITRYTEIFEALKKEGITPFVTLYHWDLPAVLKLQGYGLADRYFEDDFYYYANICFERFGKYVQNWYTFNEPWIMSVLNDFKQNEKGAMPYNYSYHILMAHAKVVKLYREKYKARDKGVIGMVFNTDMAYPKDNNNHDDVMAAYRAMNFSLGWFADPVIFGDYPTIMKERVGSRLPKFTEDEKKLLEGSVDFFAFNHYTSTLCENGPEVKPTDYDTDVNVKRSNNPDWKYTDMDWPIVPRGLHDLLLRIKDYYMKEKSKEMPIYITENGMANKEIEEKAWRNDTARIDYLKQYLKSVEQAIEEKANVKGYFVWSLLDNFEWWQGYSKRFGLVRVEYGDKPQRIPKESYYWYSEFIKNNTKS